MGWGCQTITGEVSKKLSCLLARQSGCCPALPACSSTCGPLPLPGVRLTFLFSQPLLPIQLSHFGFLGISGLLGGSTPGSLLVRLPLPQAHDWVYSSGYLRSGIFQMPLPMSSLISTIMPLSPTRLGHLERSSWGGHVERSCPHFFSIWPPRLPILPPHPPSP